MSITAETAKAHAHDPAVLCCRAEAGITIEPANLEDPAIFDDLVDSGLLNLDGCLTIEEVLGAKLTKTCDSLCPLTNDVLDGVKAPTTPVEEAEEEAPAEEAAPAAPVATAATVAGGTLKIHIGEGKDINLEIPVGALGATGEAVAEVPAAAVAATATAEAPVEEAKVVGTLTRRHIKITEVKRGPETKIEGTTLYIREGIEAEVIADQELVKDFHLEIITPDQYHTYSETIMDVQPIATKEGDAILGEGATRVLDGVVMMLTGTDEGGVQIGEFGSSEGYLDENIMWGRPGCPDKGEIFIKGNIVVQEKTNMERRGPMAAHTAFDIITQEIREVMKELDDSFIVEDEELKSIRRPGKKKVVIVKEIMGQGAMHDNFILPVEPVGILGARANVDLGNVPVCVSPLEVLDGCIHALTCIGPASKEMSRHYWREPLVLEALHDEEVDLCGVVFVGSPQINAEKYYVSRRVGHTVEMMDVDGAFVTTEGFGNNHIDFASHIEQIGMRGIPVVGLSFCAVQGALVVGNKYMQYMVDNNKSESGIENEVLGCNTLCQEEGIRALAMLKAAMAGEEVKAAEKKWNPNVKATNVELIEAACGKKIELVDNEQSLPMSQKRKEKYD
ncbi:D-proline reductase (dithiol) proprotein PrdA [Dorea longicatena]|jgi:D-proline reductase (dithiol) PrdA|uniref:D-proline reductase proprotein prdA n=2 Tax=Dorea longicatena TaxID=88431 RepID=A0A174C5V3_9FIRM|nr:D-proline reductase (dithiol) proprotein PrdA [Dorea longicatena]EDM62385.1 D-proline reductase, PrdA proprotein [Dorea longicatena DSM 13814]NSE43413.1 D-proline reductase (dithiol) proprotein PrdA [Dorea longicatena]UWP23126.1 D-proline reductase (dithiol) proprotein PrdA [Dorea longicatena]CUO07649.1 D-proline reductase proprotein prdA [Dorea longicatena]